MEARSLRQMTIAAYVAFDRSEEARWEYVNGEAFAMSGARPEHNVVARNVVMALTNALRGRPCVALGSDQKIATTRTGAYHYPDASVVCGSPVRDTADDHAFANPVVLVEVLSPTTADYDRGGKFVHYRSIETLREYLVIDEVSRSVEHHVRARPDQWVLTILEGGAIDLQSISVSVPLADLWVDVDRVKPG